jgi:hypothetical protein
MSELEALYGNPKKLSERIEALETTIRTFLHDVDAAGSGLNLPGNMWLQINAFRLMVEAGEAKSQSALQQQSPVKPE